MPSKALKSLGCSQTFVVCFIKICHEKSTLQWSGQIATLLDFYSRFLAVTLASMQEECDSQIKKLLDLVYPHLSLDQLIYQ